jgi:hypothetical protein
MVTTTNLSAIWRLIEDGVDVPGWVGRSDDDLHILMRTEDQATWSRQRGESLWLPVWPDMP